MDNGNRVYYRAHDGVIIYQTGEMSGASVEHREDEKIEYIDIPFGALNYANEFVAKVNVETKECEIVKINNETEEQKRIRELEDELLLQTENEIGGIL